MVKKDTRFFKKISKEIHRIANFGSGTYRSSHQNYPFYLSGVYKGRSLYASVFMSVCDHIYTFSVEREARKMKKVGPVGYSTKIIFIVLFNKFKIF